MALGEWKCDESGLEAEERVRQQGVVAIVVVAVVVSGLRHEISSYGIRPDKMKKKSRQGK